MSERDVDVVVVGAGPSGAIAAHELARLGTSVLLLDRAAFPRWKVCGACLSPGALDALLGAGLGGVPTRLGAVRLGRLVLHAAARDARLPLGESVAVSRAALDAALVRAAVEAGAHFWPESRATLGRVEPGGRHVRVVGGGRERLIRAGVVLDATGLGRGLAGGAGPAVEVDPASRVGLGATFEAGDYPVAPGDLHMAVGRHGYVGLVRVEDGRLNVAAAMDPASLRGAAPGAVVSSVLLDAGLPDLPAETAVRWRGTPLLSRRSPTAGGPRWLRVGDAAGYVEPFTGEGICWALCAGRAAARIAAEWLDGGEEPLVASWRTYLDSVVAPSQRLCRVLAGALRRPRLVAAGVTVLAAAPWVAAPVVRRAATPPPAVASSRARRIAVGGRE